MLSSAAVASRRTLQMRGTHLACSVGGYFFVSRQAHVALAQSRTLSSKNPTRRHDPPARFTPIPPRLGYCHISVSAPPEKAGTDQNGKDESLDGCLTSQSSFSNHFYEIISMSKAILRRFVYNAMTNSLQFLKFKLHSVVHMYENT